MTQLAACAPEQGRTQGTLRLQGFRTGGLGARAGAPGREGPDQTRPDQHQGVAAKLTSLAKGHSRHPRGGTYYVLAVLGEGLFHKHGAQGEAQVVFGVAHAELPARKTGLQTEGGVTGAPPWPRSQPLPLGGSTIGAPASFRDLRETFSDPRELLQTRGHEPAERPSARTPPSRRRAPGTALCRWYPESPRKDLGGGGGPWPGEETDSAQRGLWSRVPVTRTLPRLTPHSRSHLSYLLGEDTNPGDKEPWEVTL